MAYGIIYLATNTVNGKQYVGQTVTGLNLRKARHIWDTYNDAKDVCHFHNALRKYTPDAFTWEIIDKANDAEELDEKEIYWIQKLDTFFNGYNSTLGGESGFAGNGQAVKGTLPNGLEVYFISMGEAGRKLGFASSNLMQVFNGKCQNCFGFSWERITLDEYKLHLEEVANYDYNAIKKQAEEFQFVIERKPVYAESLEDAGAEILFFESVMQASKYLECNPSHIIDVAKGKRNQAKGYIFTYADTNEFADLIEYAENFY